MSKKTKWRPLGWRSGHEDPHAPEGGHTPENTEEWYAAFKRRGYYTAGGKLTKKGMAAKDAGTAEDISANRKALRDSWNTHPVVWELAARITGRVFKVDPFYNTQTKALPELERRLTGHSPERDGLLSLGQARRLLADDDCKWTAKQRAEISGIVAGLTDMPDAFPALWRGDLNPSDAAAACNGPHSITERWLSLVHAYSQHSITASFVPDNGDGWFQELGRKASLVVQLGRVPCLPPPGIKASSPRGASALLISFPPSLDRRTLPRATQDVLSGKCGLRVPLWERKRKGMQYGYVSSYLDVREVDSELAYLGAQ